MPEPRPTGDRRVGRAYVGLPSFFFPGDWLDYQVARVLRGPERGERRHHTTPFASLRKRGAPPACARFFEQGCWLHRTRRTGRRADQDPFRPRMFGVQGSFTARKTGGPFGVWDSRDMRTNSRHAPQLPSPRGPPLCFFPYAVS